VYSILSSSSLRLSSLDSSVRSPSSRPSRTSYPFRYSSLERSPSMNSSFRRERLPSRACRCVRSLTRASPGSWRWSCFRSSFFYSIVLCTNVGQKSSLKMNCSWARTRYLRLSAG
jgi:hypothetical protein